MKKFSILFIFSLFTAIGYAQPKWYHINKRDIALYSCMAVSGTADGFNQAIIHHDFGKGHPFSDYETSWMRKYKDAGKDDYRPAYIGSRSWLVWTTDAYHLTRAIDHTAVAASIVIASSDLKQYDKKDRWKVLLFKKGIMPMLVRGFFFTVFYDHLGYKKR
jgi:hypothetical protein